MNRESFKVGKEEYLAFKAYQDRQTKFGKEQLKYQRDMALRTNDMRISQLKAEIAYKEDQILSQELTESHDGYIDKKKPIFFLKNEILQLNLEIFKLEDSNKKLKEEQEKDDKEAENGGNK